MPDTDPELILTDIEQARVAFGDGLENNPADFDSTENVSATIISSQNTNDTAVDGDEYK